MNALVAIAKSPPALAVIRSLGRKGIEVTAASDDLSDFPLFSRFCTKKILLTSNTDYCDLIAEELLNIVKNTRFDAFLPVMREDLLLALSKRKDDFEKYTRLTLPSYDKLSILTNKAKVSALLAELGEPRPGIYFADSVPMLETIAGTAVFPLVIKPHIGEAARGVKVVTDPGDLISSYNDISKIHGPVLIQEFIHGKKHTAVFLLNKNSEVRRFFVHRAIREYPITGGPTCFLESVRYEPVYATGLKLLKSINFTGLASMEFIVDEKEGKPKIIDVNPRFYGPLQCAISAGADLPWAVYKMALDGDIETDLSYKEGVSCRNLLFEDTKHLISVLKGDKSARYRLGKIATLVNYLNFFRDDSYFVFSLSDPMPVLKKIFRHL